MEDYKIFWYIAAALIYFISRSKKKKSTQKHSRPGTENNPPPRGNHKSFEELLREITEGNSDAEVERDRQEERAVEEEEREDSPKELELEDNNIQRSFADEESKRVYEESIKLAEGADIEFAKDEKYKTKSLLKSKHEGVSKTYAEELMDGFDAEEAKKAIIYSEIFARKY